MKNTIGWFAMIFIMSVLAPTAMATESAFDLQGEGRAADMTSVEKNVFPDQDLVITIIGTSRYRMPSKGKFSLYTEKRQRIKEIRFALQPGETKSWEFPAREKIKFVDIGVYGKGELKVMMQQDSEKAAKAATSTKPATTAQDLPGSSSPTHPPEKVSGSFQQLLRDAEKYYLGGKKLEAVEQLKQAVLEIWNEVPLTIKNARFVEDTKTYATRKNNAFRGGEKMHINAQIFGYGLKQIGESYSIDITTDVYFLQKGEILAGQQNFGKFEFVSPMPNTEFRLDLTYWLNDAPPGLYDVQTVVHDQNSGQSATFTMQIEMK